MPWVTPSSVSTGDTLQASEWNQSVVLNSLMGQPVFTNEAARDAAIPSPSEGQMCYLTAPTVPTASGDTYAATPTGVTTIYNGSVWVCVTPVGAYTAATGTTTSASFTATLSGSPGTNPSVTLVTGTSAMVSLRATLDQNTAGATAFMAFAVSGATTLAANGNNSISIAKATNMASGHGATIIVTGLTAGTNTFTLNYLAGGGGTASFERRSIVVQGVA